MKQKWRFHHTVPAVTALVLTACVTTAPAPVTESLDARTGATLTRLGEPLQLLATAARSREADPFAFVAPFDVNRMGDHRLYLWVSVPAKAATTRIECEGRAVDLRATDPDALSLSTPPYDNAAPWASYGIYELDRALLDCLARDPKPAVLVGSEAADRFESSENRTGDVRAFRDRVTR